MENVLSALKATKFQKPERVTKLLSPFLQLLLITALFTDTLTPRANGGPGLLRDAERPVKYAKKDTNWLMENVFLAKWKLK